MQYYHNVCLALKLRVWYENCQGKTLVEGLNKVVFGRVWGAGGEGVCGG